MIETIGHVQTIFECRDKTLIGIKSLIVAACHKHCVLQSTHLFFHVLQKRGALSLCKECQSQKTHQNEYISFHVCKNTKKQAAKLQSDKKKSGIVFRSFSFLQCRSFYLMISTEP